MAIQCQRCGRWLPQVDKHLCMDEKFEAVLARLEKLDLDLEERLKALKLELKRLKEHKE